MAIIDLYSKRKKRASQVQPDVYRYDNIPQPLRAQVVHIWIDTLGSVRPRSYTYLRSFEGEKNDYIYAAYAQIVKILCREHGSFSLGTQNDSDPDKHLINFFLAEASADQALEIIELAFRLIINRHNDQQFMMYVRPKMKADDAVAELNVRFQEHAVGYRFENGKIIRLDSEILHSEVMKPALALLQVGKFDGAMQEFLHAHEHLRKREFDDCLNDSLKALESTLKTICQRKKWPLSSNAKAKDLIGLVFENGLIPQYLVSHFSSLRSMLESGMPTIRNKDGAHGQGEQIKDIPDYLAAYALHITGSSIVLLIRAFEQSG